MGAQNSCVILQHRSLICKIETLKLTEVYPPRASRAKLKIRRIFYVGLHIPSTCNALHLFCFSITVVWTAAGLEHDADRCEIRAEGRGSSRRVAVISPECAADDIQLPRRDQRAFHNRLFLHDDGPADRVRAFDTKVSCCSCRELDGRSGPPNGRGETSRRDQVLGWASDHDRGCRGLTSRNVRPEERSRGLDRFDDHQRKTHSDEDHRRTEHAVYFSGTG